ncbi:serine/threonine-protein phosphatase [Nakamurella sp. PAMC28650]|nr:serine/threonine-protein phosphatase [Nakamurella sp. PAMC28650]
MAPMTHVIRYAARTDRGLLRANNQDSVFAGDRLLVIADGMGGHAAGDVASRLVVAAFVDLDELPLGSDMVRPLTDATREGNAAIAEMVDENPELDGMGTTLTALLFDGPVVALAHVGDSRAYLYRNGVLHQISHDDTFVQSLVDDGRITADEAAHHPQRSLLLRALNGTEMDPSITMREISPGDRFLICSDGLSDVVSPESIADTLAGADTDQVADTLIQLALVGGGPDNVTVIVADVLETGGTGAFGAAGGTTDPEATGPMQPIHLTQRMPRVPLPPIPEDVPAKPEYAQDEEGPDEEDEDEEDEDAEFVSASDADTDSPVGTDGVSDRRLVSAPPAGRWRRRWAFGLALVILVGVGITGSVLWATSKYYVGENGQQVAVFRGVNGSLLGWRFASVQENSCGYSDSGCTPLMVTDLVQAARDQVGAGIPVPTLADARAVITRLTSQQLPPCPVAGSTPGAITSGAVTSGSVTSGTATAGGAAASTAASLPRTAPPPAPTTTPQATAPRTTPKTPVRSSVAKTTARTTPRTTAKSATKTTARNTVPTTVKSPSRSTTQPVTTIVIKPVVPVTTTVTVTVNPQAPSVNGVTQSGQRLRVGSIFGLVPVASPGPITRAAPSVTTPTVTVFTTTTVPLTVAGQSSQSGTPLVSPAAQPGITCRVVP